MECAERLEGISGTYKKNWQFVHKSIFRKEQGCCGYYDNYDLYEKGLKYPRTGNDWILICISDF